MCTSGFSAERVGVVCDHINCFPSHIKVELYISEDRVSRSAKGAWVEHCACVCVCVCVCVCMEVDVNNMMQNATDTIILFEGKTNFPTTCIDVFGFMLFVIVGN